MNQEEWKGQARQEHLYELLEKIDLFYCFSGVNFKKLLAFKIAFEEMFVNITKYAYPDKEDGQRDVTIIFKWQEEEKEAWIEMVDSGIPYNPLNKEEPDILSDAMKRAIGGLGIYMVKEITDQLLYSYENGKNRVTLVKKLI